MTLVSVVMPSLDNGRYIGEAISSVLEQQGPEVELLIQDGGSTDETMSVIEGLDDERISLVSEPDRNQSDALNRGIERAGGEWILCLNADDVLTPDAFSEAQRALEGDYDVVYGDYVLIDARGEFLKLYRSSPEFTRRRLLTSAHSYVFHGSAFVRRDVFRRFGGFDESLENAIDYDFFLRIAPRVRAAHCNHVVGCFRVHPTSKTSSTPWQGFREIRQLIRRHGGYDRGLAIKTAYAQVRLGAWLATLPLWRSRLWRRLRPVKQV